MRKRDDKGFSLTELIVAMSIFGGLMAITFALLIMVMNQSKDSQARALSLQEMRLGVSQIDRQVRSGNVILDPGQEPPGVAGPSVGPYYSMRILTQEGGETRCAQWRVIDEDEDGYGNLEFRSWSPSNPSGADPWGVVAHNTVDVGVNPASDLDIDANDATTWPPFWVDVNSSGTTGAQLVRVTLRLRDPGQTTSQEESVTTVITGRNTVFGYSSHSCDAVPPA
jgi:prepilin-type N-terminal cleavage/methylation domain-containing protein